MKFLNRLWAIAGWLLFLFLVGRFVSKHGVWWTFGRFGMPVQIIGPDGAHYLDGTPIDPYFLMAARAGCEEEIELAILGLIALSFAILFLQIWRMHVLVSGIR